MVFETQIEKLVGMIPALTSNGITNTPTFYIGKGDAHVNQFLSLQESPPYPLVFLISNPEDENIRTGQIQRNCTFVIATREFAKNELNTVRLAGSFADVLLPLKEYLVEILEASSITQIVGDNISVEKVYNYSSVSSDNGKIIDVWDAIVLKCEVLMFDTCLKTFVFN